MEDVLKQWLLVVLVVSVVLALHIPVVSLANWLSLWLFRLTCLFMAFAFDSLFAKDSIYFRYFETSE